MNKKKKSVITTKIQQKTERKVTLRKPKAEGAERKTGLR